MRFSAALLLASALLQSSDSFVPKGLPTFGLQSTAPSTQLASFTLTLDVPPQNSTSGTVSAPKDTTVAAVPKVAQRWRKSTKQLITLGPASSNREMIEKLFLAGADLFRLNFSHGSQEQKLELLQIIREVEEKYNHPIGILGDLQGPKLRVSGIFLL